MIGPSPGLEIINACRLLFPSTIAVDAGFLNTIASEDLKTAFRKKALKTHPDRSIALGRSQEELSRMFQEVSSAYKTLEAYFLQRETGNGQTAKPHYQRTRRPTSSMRTARPGKNDYYYTGLIPERELRLGEFLYYSKIISWRTLINAIVWQKRQRPLFGQIARQWKFLSDDDIRLILQHKGRDEVFGEFALRHGFLSRFQQMAVTGRQRQLQPLIGMHFVESGLMTIFHVNLMVRRKDLHNRRIRFN